MTGDPDSADWHPRASLGAIRARAGLLARLRAHFAAVGVLEVETPVVSRAAVCDPALETLTTAWRGSTGPHALYLQPSPELAMKRLLAAGSGPVYQICKVFRDNERGRLHHPEFTLLEWYRPGWDYWRLMSEAAEVVRAALDRAQLPEERIGYRDLFRERLSLDPWVATVEELARAARAHGIGGAHRLELSRDGWLDLLLSHCLGPHLGRGCLCFLHDYPPSQALLARCRDQDSHPVAERFELFLEGVELANGFQELTDPHEQRRRFARDLAQRAALGQAQPPVDQAFLAALDSGLPECAGVALGLDRLLMQHLGLGHIDEVLAFPIERA